MQKLQLRKLASQRVKEQAKLVKEQDFVDEGKLKVLKEGESIELIDNQGKFAAYCLVGRQNKGIGWIYSQTAEDVWTEELVYDRLEEAFFKRTKMESIKQSNAYRLFNGEGDGIGGVTIDYYNEYLLINWYSEGIYRYQDWFLNSIEDLQPKIKGIYASRRFRNQALQSKAELIAGEAAEAGLIIQENQAKYAVTLGTDWMTGIFLDQREVRKFIYEQAQGGKLLNLFSYTGAFSVAAALGANIKTISVDVANRSLAATKEQFELNGLSTDPSHHEIRVMDVFAYLDYAKKHDLQFDIIVCDPPSFARGKKKQFQVEKDYPTLAADLFHLTKPGGMTLLSTNHSAYDADRFRQDMVKAAQGVAGTFHLFQQFGLPEDFPTSVDSESQYLKVIGFYREE